MNREVILAMKDTLSVDRDTTVRIVDLLELDNLVIDSTGVELGDEDGLEEEEIWGADYQFSDSEVTSIRSVATNFCANSESVTIDLDYIADNGTYPFMGVFTSNFGVRNGRQHKGIDISARNGAKDIFAVMDGVVRISTYMKGFGNVIVIRHQNGLESVYGHNRKNNVKRGDVVKSGDIIATVGSTGRSTAPHIHFEFRVDGVPIDPNFFLNVKESTFKRGEVYVHRFDSSTILASAESNKSKVIVKKYHTIRSGDTLSRISRRYGVTITQICKMNNIKSTTILRIGRQLRVT